MSVGLVSGTLRNVYIAGAAVTGAAVVMSLLWRIWVMCTRRNVHVERKAFFAYWLWGSISACVMYLWLLWGLFDADRDGAGDFVNWTRWAFYIPVFGICGNGLIAEFQLQPHSWTRLYTLASLLVVFITNIANAFADDGQARRMLGSIGAVAIGIYVIQIFYFDGRFKDRFWALFVDLVIVILVGVEIAMFVAGHANQDQISRTNEAIGYLVVECIFFFLLAPLMKWLWQARSHYVDGTTDPVLAAEYGCCGWCLRLFCCPVATAANVAETVTDMTANLVSSRSNI